MATAAVPGHAPVMLEQVLEALAIRPQGTYVDGTYGRGGHARAVLARLGAGGTLVVIDRDPQAIDDARRNLGADPRVRICQATFDELLSIVGPGGADGVLLDLGVSSPQLDDPARGFSFLRDGPLDMRMDPTTAPSAADFIRSASASELAHVMAVYGEERFARRIAAAIVTERDREPIVTTGRLAAIVAGAIPMRMHERGKHPATRTFQALRIYINRELELLDRALEAALAALRVAGRLVVISFHSLEDRRVKRFMRDRADWDPVWRGLPNAPVEASPVLKRVGKAQTADEAELARNPRARSAVLRVAERVRA